MNILKWFKRDEAPTVDDDYCWEVDGQKFKYDEWDEAQAAMVKQRDREVDDFMSKHNITDRDFAEYAMSSSSYIVRKVMLVPNNINNRKGGNSVEHIDWSIEDDNHKHPIHFWVADYDATYKLYKEYKERANDR